MWMMMVSVGLGGGLGAIMRWGVTRGFQGVADGGLYSIVLCNVVGSFGFGFLGMLLSRSPMFEGGVGWEESAWRGFVMVGIWGGFTTFSTFSYDAMILWEEGRYQGAMLYVLVSVVVSFVMMVLGVMGGRGVANILWT